MSAISGTYPPVEITTQVAVNTTEAVTVDITEAVPINTTEAVPINTTEAVSIDATKEVAVDTTEEVAHEIDCDNHRSSGEQKKKENKPHKKRRRPTKKYYRNEKEGRVRLKVSLLVLLTLMMPKCNLKKWLGIATQSYLLSRSVKRKTQRKYMYRKKVYRRGDRSHRKLVTKLIQNKPLRVVLWPSYSYIIAALFHKRKRKRTMQSASSSLHGVNSKHFVPEVISPYSEEALYRGETIPARDKPQAGKSHESSNNTADTGIATLTSSTSGGSKVKAEPQPDTSTLATGTSSWHQHEEQKFSHSSTHGAHQIPPDSVLLIPSSRYDLTPPEKLPEPAPTNTYIFGEREEFKQATSTFECYQGDEYNPWDDGLPPVNANPPRTSAVKLCSDIGPDNNDQLLSGQSACQQPTPDHLSGPSIIVQPLLPVLPSNQPHFQEVSTEPAVLIPLPHEQQYVVYSGTRPHQERDSLPDVFKSFPYMKEF